MKEQVNLSYLAAHPEICHSQAETLQRSIALETMGSRGLRGLKQYGGYFALMWVCGIIQPERASLLRSSYFWFRHLDDIADGDRALPEGYKSKQEFLQRKWELAGQMFSKQNGPIYGDEEDLLLADYYSKALKLNIDLSKESFSILDTIILDEERARKRRVLTQEELDYSFNQLDFACIGGALKVAGETCEAQDLKALNRAVRTWFNLRDFPKDFKRGIINISREGIFQYGIDLSRLEGLEVFEQVMTYAPMRRWYKDQVVTGRSFLQDGKAEVENLHLKGITRFALNFCFIRPAEGTFNRYADMLAT